MISSSSFFVNPSISCEGEYARILRDVDGDIVTVCYNSGHCPYKKIVRDVDNDKLVLCNR